MRKKIILYFLIIGIITVFIYSKFPEETLFIVSFIYFLISYILNKKHGEFEKVTRFMILTFLSIYITLILIVTLSKGIEKTNFLSLLYFLCFTISIYIGHVIAKKQDLFHKTLITLSFFTITYFCSSILNTISVQNLFFKNIDGEVNYLSSKENFTVIESKTLKHYNLSNMKEKIVVVDYWNNNCGVCFQKFPKFQKLRQKYINNKNIGFYAINSFKKKEEIVVGEKLFNSLNYNYKTYFQEKIKSDSLKIYAFPTVLVIKGNHIIFKGTIEALTLFDYKYLN